ncbi:unnamed protein product, partial [Meganyctiphanes norvegica]
MTSEVLLDEIASNFANLSRLVHFIQIFIKEKENEKNAKNLEKSSKDEENEEEKKKKKENDLPPVGFFQLFRYSNGKEKLLMFLGILAAIIAGLCMPAMIILFGDITNAFVYDSINITGIWEAAVDQGMNITLEDVAAQYPQIDFFQEVTKFGIGTAIIGVIQFLMGYIFVSTLNYAAEGQVYRLRGMFLKSILKQEIGWFDTHQTNDFASRVTEDLSKLQDGIGEKIGLFIFFMSIFLTSIINSFIHGWELTLVIMSVFPLLGISTGIIAKVQASLSAVELREYSRAGSIAEEVISSIRTVLAFGGETKEVARYEENLVDAKKAGIKRGLVTGLGMGFMWVIIYGAYALAFWYGTKLILDSRPPNGTGNYDPAKLIIVFFSVLMGAMNLGQSAPYLEAFSIARGAASTIFDVIERESQIDPTSEKGDRPETVKGTIELHDVEFKYPSRPDVPILRGVSLKVEPGQTVALVGASGCGKSTCIQLIQRFYDPINGKVLLDGRDIKTLNLGWLRDHIGVVGQEPVLFATTVAENIRYGKEGVSMEDIMQAAKQANAHDFIMRMPEKYETNVGERGAQMSGGQKQRIAIARALVRQPYILLLDEATSALDNQSEAVVQRALDKASEGRTTIIIAHRLSTIRSADVIMAFQDGQVVEVGTHETLMSNQGIYHSLVMAQLTPEELKVQKENTQTILEEEVKEDKDSPENDTLSDLGQDLVDDLISITPMSLTRSPSVRQSARRRKSRLKSSAGDEDEIPAEVPLMKILSMNSPEWLYITVGVIGSAIQGSCMPFYAILFGDVLGSLALEDPDQAREEANFYAILFLGIGIVAAVSVFMQAYFFAYSGETLTSRLRKESFSAMLRQEMGWFDMDKNSVGALCQRLSTDASAVQGATGSRVGTIIQAITTLTLSIGLALYYEWRLGLVVSVFIPFVFASVYLQTQILMGQTLTENKVLEDAGKIAIEAISNIRTVASLHKEMSFANQYSEALYEPHIAALKKSHVRGYAFGFAQSVPFFAYATAMFYGGYLVDIDIASYDSVFKVAEALILGTMMVGSAVAYAPNYSKAKVAAAHVMKLLERRPAINTSAGVGLRMNDDVSEIRLSDVHFNYPTRPDIPILSGLSVNVGRGQTLALVGSSGCGKSTIIGLLERFYDSKSGEVLISGTDIQSLNVGWTRSQLGLVSQEPTLFDRTIEDNIAYGDNSREPKMEEIISCAKQANIHSFIESLPDGYKTRVGSKGTQLSGGQKQRIAIARALLRNPKVLLLDEATSALDTESEKVMQEALESAQKGRTSIVIAHRLSTIQGADLIAVVSGGVVVEAGSHEELIKMKGHYYDLYQTNN